MRACAGHLPPQRRISMRLVCACAAAQFGVSLQKLV
jgi:hypothetical protein